ncbi:MULTISPECIES: alpha/beta hydrolase fold domain-containing protein [unclassified Nocardiopsis]|uniref:alpha/beta hydrolase fold domain-containing protein n=1 Tax=unclassified Nocardiopsis TaxID=2649073 RepID=UPI0009F81EF7|nr:alpha/beta hydrolase fold domain-containing protein [Nocardiopsis sp. TSRI0078]
MTIMRRPRVARLVARSMQAGMSLAERRATRRAHARLPEYPRRTEPLTVPTAHGPARVTVYRPEPGPRTPAVHVNLHGGGFVLGWTEMDDPLCRALAAEAGVVVLNVDYAVAPQHPFPAPPRQAYEVVRWAAAHGGDHGWDGARLTVGGQSAGGALAAAAARLDLEDGGSLVRLQVLHYPSLDLTVRTQDKHSPVDRPMLRPWMGEVFSTCYLPGPEAGRDRLASPAAPTDTADLAGVAPAVVVVAEHDILRAEGVRYAERLERVGALAALHEVRGRDHGYDVSHDDAARETYRVIAGHVARAAGPAD